jgi:hypothetical protein
MAYIKFNITKYTDLEGNVVNAKINRMESDLPSLVTLQPEIIYNALSKKGKVKAWMKLDTGLLDRDMLMGEEVMLFDVGVLDCDFMV